jgi:hypothetical protein
VRSARAVILLSLALVGCRVGAPGPGPNGAPAAKPGPLNETPPASRPLPIPFAQGPRTDEDLDFKAILAESPELDYAGLVRVLGLHRAPDAPPRFDPTAVDHFASVQKELQLTPEELSLYRRNGMVGIDDGEHVSMAGAYLEIYAHDLPVLITSDSILHALHRSFDNMMLSLELQTLIPELKALLDALRAALPAVAGTADTSFENSARDVDLYLTVARRLLGEDQNQPIGSLLGQDAGFKAVLQSVAQLHLNEKVSIYGSEREIDWSQFKPRGHYAAGPPLSGYFQAMMWLGRADLGFTLAPERTNPDPDRQFRDAGLLAALLVHAGQLDRLARFDRLIRFFVGESDDTGPAGMVAALAAAGVRAPRDLAAPGTLDHLRAALATSGARHQKIRSQIMWADRMESRELALPDVFQLLGQRFVIDSFVLSKVVFDTVPAPPPVSPRLMPSVLDVMAALGNDEAMALLESEIGRYHYAREALAVRRYVERQPNGRWEASLYGVWLSALTTLDDHPEGKRFPEVMRGRAWQTKQLTTQLASWTELRHDTVLYAKQSMTSGIICEYPAGYVEPYPAFFTGMARFAELASVQLADQRNALPDLVKFFDRFGALTARLAKLAQKELDGEPFSDDERGFVKDIISVSWRGGGCGGPRPIYSGWYADLIYRGAPDAWEPVIADVHTDPNSGNVLEVGTGDAKLLVVAVDNGTDRAAYVGPVSSFYELTTPQRLTDDEWRRQLARGAAPPVPAWTSAYQAPRAPRTIRVRH